MVQRATNAAQAAAYYDAADISAFYRLCWGGADIHIGRYDTGAESVAEASLAMTRHLLSLANLRPGDRVLDIACGYGGTLRELARLGCDPTGIDISHVCVEEARRANAQAGYADTISVEIGDFHDIQSPDGAWDACVCQESIIHSAHRPRVFAEVRRVLKPGGIFLFSDILTAERGDLDMVDAAFERLGVEAGATPRDYEEMAMSAGFEVLHSEERQQDIRTHYDKLAETLRAPVPGLDPASADRIAASIARWQRALSGGNITWSCFLARRPEADRPDLSGA